MRKHRIFSMSVSGRRSNNEDALIAQSTIISGVPVSIVAVADGMGGQACGEIASNIAIKILKNRWADWLVTNGQRLADDPHSLREYIYQTFDIMNREIREYSIKNPESEGMGTTLVAIFTIGDKALIANVGDSRAYLIYPDTIKQVTLDHSAVAEGIRDGFLTEREAEKSPYRHALTRSVDGLLETEVDIFPLDGGWFDLPTDSFMFTCSDGLTGAVKELEMYDHFMQTKNVNEASQGLVALAYEQGSTDNISIATLEIGKVKRLEQTVLLKIIPEESLNGSLDHTTNPTDKTKLQQILLVAAGLALATLLLYLFSSI